MNAPAPANGGVAGAPQAGQKVLKETSRMTIRFGAGPSQFANGRFPGNLLLGTQSV
jgi:hypothetical protein